MNKPALVALLTLFATATHAQTSVREATNVELKATYCGAVLRTEADGLRTFMKNVRALPNKGPETETQLARLEREAQTDDRAISRIEAYLQPKQGYIDHVGPSAAQKLGASDAEIELETSIDKGPQSIDPGLSARVNACHHIDYLPF